MTFSGWETIPILDVDEQYIFDEIMAQRYRFDGVLDLVEQISQIDRALEMKSVINPSKIRAMRDGLLMAKGEYLMMMDEG